MNEELEKETQELETQEETQSDTEVQQQEML